MRRPPSEWMSCLLIHRPIFGAEEANEVGAVGWCADAVLKILAEHLALDLGCHPAGVGRPGVDDVGRDAEVGQVDGGGEHDAIHRTPARAVGQIERGVVARQRHDPSTSGPVGELLCEGLDQKPGGPGVDGEVSIERLCRGVQNRRVHRLRVAERERGDRTEIAPDLFHEALGRARIGQIYIDRGWRRLVRAPRHPVVVACAIRRRRRSARRRRVWSLCKKPIPTARLAPVTSATLGCPGEFPMIRMVASTMRLLRRTRRGQVLGC